ncbi:protein of unknown function [Pararobbsia alpina]|uniref:Tar ligand binding domain-containing protein n=1 Tax=Pararobbsia alpina TaxID=621374 RepID=UPI0039A5B6DE
MTVSIKTRLAVAMALLASLLAVVGALGLMGKTGSNDANRQTYSNALPSVNAIGEVEIVMARQRAALLRAALDPAAPDLDGIIKKSKGFADQASDIWSRYMALSRDAEQDRLALDTESKRQAFSQGLDKFAQAIKSGDQKAIMRAALENNDYYAAFTASNEKLKHATFEGAKQLYETQQQSFSRFRVIVLLAIGAGALAAALSWYLTTDDGAAVRAWTSAAFASDMGVRQLARAFTSYGWSQGMGFGGMGDVVAKRVTSVRPTSMARLIDLDAFRVRVESVAAAGASPEVREFLEAWQRADQGTRD